MALGFSKVHSAALAAAITATSAGLTGCDIHVGQQQAPGYYTPEQDAACEIKGDQAASKAQGDINNAKPSGGREIIDRLADNPQRNTAVITANARRQEAYDKCIANALAKNASDRTDRQTQQKADAAPAMQAPVDSSVPVDSAAAPAPVESRPVPLSPAETINPKPAATFTPVVSIGKLPPYAPEAVVLKDAVLAESYGKANMQILAKTIMQSGEHKESAPAVDANRVPVIKGQFVAQTAQKFGMNAGDINDLQAVVAAGKLQVYNNDKLTKTLGRPPEDYQVAFASKLGADAVAALIQSPPDKNAVEVLVAAYKGDKEAANNAVISIKDNLDITAAQLLDLQRTRYNAASANEGAAIVSDVMVANGKPPIGSAMRNTADTSLDQTPLGGAPAASATGGIPESPLTPFIRRVFNSEPAASAAASR